MPIHFSFLADRDLALVVFDGIIRAEDRAAALDTFITHRRYRPGRKQLVDLSGVTGWEDGFEAALTAQQAQLAWLFQDPAQALRVHYAPTERARRMAAMRVAAWDGIPAIVPLVLDDEAEALAILGQTEMRVSEMLEAA